MLFPHLNLQEQPVVTGRKTHGQRGDDRIISKLKPECAGTSLPFLYGFPVFFLSWRLSLEDGVDGAYLLGSLGYVWRSCQQLLNQVLSVLQNK